LRADRSGLLLMGGRAKEATLIYEGDIPSRHARGKGFTLIELLVVVAIVSLLTSILIPSLQRVRELGRSAVCIGTLRGIGTAAAAYSISSNGYSVHGVDMEYAWPLNETGYGRCFFGSHIFDDDWGDSLPGTEGRNLYGGGQNICGVGQLMWDYHLPEAVEAIACPQADYREITGYGLGQHTFRKNPYSGTSRSTKKCLARNWRGEHVNWEMNPTYEYNGSTYVVRGPLFRLSTVRIGNQDVIKNAADIALFADHEQINQTPVNNGWVASGESSLPYWSRCHKAGINVLYLDGHASMFPDEDRSLTYWARYARYYGNREAIMYGSYDGN